MSGGVLWYHTARCLFRGVGMGMGKLSHPLYMQNPLHATPRGFPCALCTHKSYTLLVILDASPFYRASPLRFRDIADSHIRTLSIILKAPNAVSSMPATLKVHSKASGRTQCPRWLRSQGLYRRTYIETPAFTVPPDLWHLAKPRPTLGDNRFVQRRSYSLRTQKTWIKRNS